MEPESCAHSRNLGPPVVLAMTAHAGGRGTMWYCRAWTCGGCQLCHEALRLDGSISSPLSQNDIHLWGRQRDGVKQGGPKVASSGSADSKDPVMASYKPISHQPTSMSPTLRVTLPSTTHSGQWQAVSCVCCPCQKAGWSDLCKPSRQSLGEEVKLVLPQNNGCL